MENAFAWGNQVEGAVSLTYDDGLPIHCSLVAPILQHHGLLATFYPMIHSDSLVHPERWMALAAAGHELGNHTVFHPCRQSRAKPYLWLDERYDLGRYTPAHMRAELEVANLVLHLLDGQDERSYGNTCCDTSIGSDDMEEPLEPLLRQLFVAARGALTNQIAHPARRLNLFNIGCIDVAGWSFGDLQGIVEQTRASGGWAVLMIHGIGQGTHDLYLESNVHERFISWLAQQATVWTGPVRLVARYVREHTELTRPAE